MRKDCPVTERQGTKHRGFQQIPPFLTPLFADSILLESEFWSRASHLRYLPMLSSVGRGREDDGDSIDASFTSPGNLMR